MPGFDVLDRDLALNRNCFLEASAGTGKTFAIETLLIRLLIQENGPTIDEILVVTFTKAATIELKARIRKKIEEVISLLKEGKEASEDYLRALQEKSDETVGRALKCLTRALNAFDEAKIYTIHSFCFKSLEENPILGGFSLAQTEEDASSFHVVRRIVKDHIRTSNDVHPQEWDLLLRGHRGDFEKVLTLISTLSNKRLPLEQGRSFQEISSEFFLRIQKMAFSKDKVLEELLQIAPCYGKMCNKQKKLKKEVIDDLMAFSSLFEKVAAFPLETSLLEMQPSNLLKSAHLPHAPLWEAIQKELLPLLEEGQDQERILSRLAEGARKRIEKVTKKEEIYFFEDLIQEMRLKVKEPLFAEKVRSKFKAVFIDEFQDTDQAQWDIFSTLFAKENFNGLLYLIGDPKQSIYRFRHADLYTFMRAKSHFAEEEKGGLVVNFRSNCHLVEALNHLLTEIPDFLHLPKTNQNFPCPKLFASPTRAPFPWHDEKGSVHFFQGESEEEFFSFVVQEIKRLHREEKIPLDRFGVLVKDRFQGEAFCAFAKKHHLPVAPKRSRLLMDSLAFSALPELIEALRDLRNKGSIAKVLAGPIFQWDHALIEKLQLSQIKSQTSDVIDHFFSLKCALEERGILGLMDALFSDKKLTEKLFITPHGLALYADMNQLAELIALEQISIENIPSFFSKLKNEGGESEALQARCCESERAVQVMTIHLSKGLEFAVVFPLGLIKTVTLHKEIVADVEREVLTFRQEAFEAHKEEIEAEKMRLLYVALTRAKERLYLPILLKEKKELSPMALFLEKFLKGKTLEEAIAQCPHITLSSAKCEIDEEVMGEKEESLLPPKKMEFHSFPSYIRSFTSLAKHSPPFQEKIVDDSLPAGKEFGTFLHTLFEKPPSALEKTIDESAYKMWKEKILHLMSSALHVPLSTFCLADVDSKKMIREMEFLYPGQGEDHLKGFIDLVFEHEGALYIVDWKSNLLENYSPEKLFQAMEENDYFLQARIYKEAVERYLSLFKPKCRFGGIFYLFLRGPAVYKVEYDGN